MSITVSAFYCVELQSKIFLNRKITSIKFSLKDFSNVCFMMFLLIYCRNMPAFLQEWQQIDPCVNIRVTVTFQRLIWSVSTPPWTMWPNFYRCSTAGNPHFSSWATPWIFITQVGRVLPALGEPSIRMEGESSILLPCELQAWIILINIYIFGQL